MAPRTTQSLDLDMVDASRRLFEVLGGHPQNHHDAKSGDHIATHIENLAISVIRPPPARSDTPPPHSIALSMATAIYAQPHLVVTFPQLFGALPEEKPLLLSNEAMSAALGIPIWELEDLREEVDRRAGTFLKRVRTLRWLKSHFQGPDSTPESLFQVLFPGSIDFTNRGVRYRVECARLYAIADIPPPRSELVSHLRWIDERDPSLLLDFYGRYIDLGLRRAMCRSLGASEAEVNQLLDHIITLVPRDAEPETVAIDQWIAEGYAQLTGLGRPSNVPRWIQARIEGPDLDHTPWLSNIDGKLAIRKVRRAFDKLALPRVEMVMRQVYAAMLASLLVHKRLDPRHQRQIFDFQRHVAVAVEPLLDWIRRPSSVPYLAGVLDADPGDVRVLMNRVRTDWETQGSTAWMAPPSIRRPHTVQAIMAAHLAATQRSLLTEYHRTPDPRHAHQRILMLFTADYLGNAPLARLWLPDNGRLPPPEDVNARWFWPTWQRVLDHQENDDPVREDHG